MCANSESLTSLTDVQADEKTNVAAVTSSLKPRKQPDSMNHGNRQLVLVAESMTSYLLTNLTIV